MFEWDPGKAAGNLKAHKVSFDAVERFEWETALTGPDAEHSDDEERIISLGFIGVRLHVLIWTTRGECIRVISLRKATKKEEKHYANNI